MQIAAKETLRKALWFALGVTIVEMAYLRVTMGVIGSLAANSWLFLIFRVVSVVILLVMAVGSFMAVSAKEGKNIILDNKAKRLVLGATMSAVNPMQVPFWMGWVIYLLSRSIIVNNAWSNNIFTLSAGIGTFVALLLFIFAGRKFSGFMLRNKKMVNIIVGVLFTVMAIFQFIKLF
jgi:cytochrome c biogenesis protein CcdA